MSDFPDPAESVVEAWVENCLETWPSDYSSFTYDFTHPPYKIALVSDNVVEVSAFMKDFKAKPRRFEVRISVKEI